LTWIKSGIFTGFSHAAGETPLDFSRAVRAALGAMVWLPSRWNRGKSAPDAEQPARPAWRESTPQAFAVRLAVLFGLVLITPGLHMRGLAVLSAAAGVVVGYGAACARERLDARGFTAWDEAVGFVCIAWLAFRLF
jgi:hypothetical protein